MDEDGPPPPKESWSSQSSFLGGAKTRNVHASTFFSKIDFDNDGQLDAEELKKYVAQAIGGIEFDERKKLSRRRKTIKQMDKQSGGGGTISSVGQRVRGRTRTSRRLET